MLREQRGLRMFENRKLRICGPKKVEVKESWRKLHHEKLHNLYASIKTIRWSNQEG
jgi:hypothetical protein